MNLTSSVVLIVANSNEVPRACMKHQIVHTFERVYWKYYQLTIEIN